jgi:hypothetical protein
MQDGQFIPDRFFDWVLEKVRHVIGRSMFPGWNKPLNAA